MPSFSPRMFVGDDDGDAVGGAGGAKTADKTSPQSGTRMHKHARRL